MRNPLNEKHSVGLSGDQTIGGEKTFSDDIAFVSGKGLDFSAITPATGSTSQVMVSYEEGYHTATIVGVNGGNFVLSTGGDTLAFTKVGRVVHVQGRLTVDSDNSVSGRLRVSLPYVVLDLTDIAESPYTGCSFHSHGAGDIVQPMVLPVVSQSYAEFHDISHTGAISDINETVVDGAWSVSLNFNYIA